MKTYAAASLARVGGVAFFVAAGLPAVHAAEAIPTVKGPFSAVYQITVVDQRNPETRSAQWDKVKNAYQKLVDAGTMSAEQWGRLQKQFEPQVLDKRPQEKVLLTLSMRDGKLLYEEKREGGVAPGTTTAILDGKETYIVDTSAKRALKLHGTNIASLRYLPNLGSNLAGLTFVKPLPADTPLLEGLHGNLLAAEPTMSNKQGRELTYVVATGDFDRGISEGRINRLVLNRPTGPAKEYVYSDFKPIGGGSMPGTFKATEFELSRSDSGPKPKILVTGVLVQSSNEAAPAEKFKIESYMRTGMAIQRGQSRGGFFKDGAGDFERQLDENDQLQEKYLQQAARKESQRLVNSGLLIILLGLIVGIVTFIWFRKKK